MTTSDAAIGATAAELIQLAIIFILILSIFIGNASLIVSICATSDLHNAAGFIVLSLTVADLFVGIWLLPFSIPAVINHGWQLGPVMCDINGFTNHVLSTASILGLFVISIDRYISLFYPLRYYDFMTTKRALILISCTWGYAVFTAIFPLIGWSRYIFVEGVWLCVTNFKASYTFSYFIILSVYGIPLAIMALIYYRIFRMAFHHAKAIEQQANMCKEQEQSDGSDRNDPRPTVNRWLNAAIEAHLEMTEFRRSVDRTASEDRNMTPGRYVVAPEIRPTDAMHFVNNRRINARRNKKKRLVRLKKEVRTGLMLFVIVVIFIISWTPFAILNLWSLHTGKKTPVISEAIVSRLAYANSAINPPLYCLMNRIIRRAMRKFWYRVLKSIGLGSCFKCSMAHHVEPLTADAKK